MILNHIHSIIDLFLRGNQAGFRPGKSTTSQVLALRRVLEGVREKSLPAILVFVDFCKAFDSISHASMFNILESYGIPPKLLGMIKLCYENLIAKVKSEDGETDYFKIHAGVMQGDTLAPFLLILVLDHAMTKAINGRELELGLTLQKRQSSRNPGKAICDLDFADDIVLLADDIERAKELLKAVQLECRKVGLELNDKKTEAMYFNNPISPISTVDGTPIKQAKTECGDQDCKYLGCWSCQDREIQTRKALAWQSLNKMSKVWKSKIDPKIKMLLFRATTESILTYGCATWTLTERDENKLDGTYTKMLRAVFNISWKDKIPNEQLYAGHQKLSQLIRTRRLKLAGHMFRDETNPAHSLVTWKPKHGTAKIGRPSASFPDILCSDLQIETVRELEQHMRDRNSWRFLTSRDICPNQK